MTTTWPARRFGQGTYAMDTVEKRPRGRPKGFIPDEALDRAVGSMDTKMSMWIGSRAP